MAREEPVPQVRLRGLIRTLLMSLIVLVLTAAPGAAARQTVPSGNSEVDQYTETLPGASGNQPTNSQGNGGASAGRVSRSGAPVLSEQAAQQLRRRGAAGRAVAHLAQATAPKDNARSGERDGGSSSGLGSAVDTVSGSKGGGLGILLPLILGGVAAAGLGYVFRRRRARLPG